jgi:chromosomal replication initiation ATPase DnaA
VSQQLSFDLPSVTALGRDDFFVSPSNAVAVAMIDAWPEWAGARLVLTGPAGSGKTHLVHVWAANSGAQIVEATDLTEPAIPDLAGGPVAVENVQNLQGNPDGQTALFHLFNLVLAEGHSILLTGDRDPSLWGLALPDLQSRMQSAQIAPLQDPDDALLSVVMAKLLADKQLTPPPDVIPYLIKRIDRSFAAARDVIDRLDRFALDQGKPITRPLAVRLLDNAP